MDEKVLVRSKCYKAKKEITLALIIAIVLSLIVAFFIAQEDISYNLRELEEEYEDHKDTQFHLHLLRYHEKDLPDDAEIENLRKKFPNEYSTTEVVFRKIHPTKLSYIFCQFGELFILCDDTYAWLLFSFIPYLWLAVLLIFKAANNNTTLTVTSTKVYGTVGRRRVDLPLDSISAVACTLAKGIAVGTSSGRIKFYFIENQEEIHSVIGNLIIERQVGKTSGVKMQNADSGSGKTSELKELKELLDSGIITQEEFDAKKKQILEI